MKIGAVPGVSRVDDMAISLLANVEPQTGRARSSAGIEDALKQETTLGPRLGAVAPGLSFPRNSGEASFTRRQGRKS